MRQQAFALGSDLLPANPGGQYPKTLQILYRNGIHGIANAQQAYRQPVMAHRVEAGAAQYGEQLVAQCQRPRYQAIDMTFEQIIRVFVIAAEHHLVRPFADQWMQSVEVACRRAFPDQDRHAGLQLVLCFIKGGAFVIGTDSCSGITGCGFACQPRCMSVYRHLMTPCDSEFLLNIGTVGEYAREIHHFRQVTGRAGTEQLFQLGSIEGGTGSFECRGRYAGGCAPENTEGTAPTVFGHEIDALDPQYIGDLMRIRDAGNSAVATGNAAELGRGQHGAFNMHMRIYPARHQKRLIGSLGPLLTDLGNDALLPAHLTEEDSFPVYINNVAGKLTLIVHAIYAPEGLDSIIAMKRPCQQPCI